uniref:Ion transport domain-containing protein n=1 Tax=Alexandrium catenella TaxID=2925 RepID=A0A7S1WD71_ALECA
MESLNAEVKAPKGSTLEELKPWIQGLQTAKGLADLGLYEAPGVGSTLRLTTSMRDSVEQDLSTAFHAHLDPDVTLSDPTCPTTKISEALMYVGLFGLALTNGKAEDISKADFVSLGLELLSARLSSKQTGVIEKLYRQGDASGDALMTRANATRLLRETVHSGISMAEVDDLVNLCGGSAARRVDSETFAAMMARMVRKHEREWCVLQGVRDLLGARESNGVSDRLTAEMLTENGKIADLTLEQAEEMLWSANIGCDTGVGLDISMVGLALWPNEVSAHRLPPAPRSEEYRAPALSLDGFERRSLVTDIRSVPLPLSSSDLKPLWELSCTNSRKLSLDTMETHDEQVLEVGEKEIPNTCRAKLHLLLFQPESSSSAARWSVVLGMLIMVSCLTLVFEPLISPSDQKEAGTMSETEKAVWAWFEIFFTAVFTVEWLLRLAVADALGTQGIVDFLKSPMNICDIIAVLPWYTDQLLGSAQEEFRLLRIVRLMRLARLVRLGRLAAVSPVFAPIAMILVVIWGIFLKSTFT